MVWIGAQEKQLYAKGGAADLDDVALRAGDGLESNLRIEPQIRWQRASECGEVPALHFHHDVCIVRGTRDPIRIGHEPARDHVRKTRRGQSVQQGANRFVRFHSDGAEV